MLAASVLLLLFTARPQASPERPTLLVGDPAPPFVVERFLRGEPRTLLAPGRVHVVEFWATWCGPCIAGMPHLTALQRELGPKGLDVIGVATRPDEWGHDLASIEALIARKGDELGYALALDAESDSAEGYQGVFRGRTIESWMGAADVGAIPIAFVIDREGHIAAIAPPLEIDATVRACLDGMFDRERAAREYRALLAARAQLRELEALLPDEPAVALALTEELLAGPLWQDARHLSSIAERWGGAGAGDEGLALALRAARRADELCRSADPGTLGSLARLLFRAGERDEAERAHERASTLAEGGLREALEREFAAVRGSATPAGAPEPDPELGTALDDLVNVYAGAGEFSGVILVARGDAILLRKAYGLADGPRGVPNTCTTRFHVASLTKTFTAAAVLLLAREGRLALADPVARFLPDYPRGNEITLEHLLLHRAGIPDHHGLAGFEALTAGPVTARAMVALARPFPLEFAPGSQHRYTNSGYTLLAHLVEVVSGRPFDAFVRERLLAPLGMESTGEAPRAAQAPERALGHAVGRAPTWLEPVPARNYSYAVGSGSLESTADDLLRWMKALDRGDPVDLLGQSYPYGWGKREGFGRPRIEQTGLHDGFAAVMAFYPGDDLYIVSLSNVAALGAWRELQLGLAAIVFGAELEWPERAPVVMLERAAAERLTGRFRHPDGFEFTVELAADGLRLGGPWEALHVLDPLAPGRLRYRRDGAELRFPDGPGRPASVAWIERSDERTCPRIDPPSSANPAR